LNDWGNSNAGAQNGKWGWAITCKRPFTETCPAGYTQMGNIGDDVRGWGLVRMGNRASSLADCRAQCDRDTRCGSFEYNKEKGECALNDWGNSNAGAQNGKWGWAITCQRPFISMSCPAGYTQMGNIGDDVRGWGLVRRGNRASSLGDCQAQCDRDTRCGSFEYNKEKGECALNDWGNSNAGAQNGKWGWALTCQRPFTMSCPAGYKQMGNIGDDVRGWGLVRRGNRASSLGDCQAQCGRDTRCGSFEYNKESGECALNDWGNSNAGAQNGKWGWAITCQRPFISMSCPADYSQMGNIGDDVRGWGLVRMGNRASSLADCRAQCDRDNRCGSFEYNKEKGECALNDWANSNADAQNGKWGWALTCARTGQRCPVRMFEPCPRQGRVGTDDCPAGCEHVTNCMECSLAAKVWASKGFSWSEAPFALGAVRPTGCFRNRKNLVKCNSKNPTGGAKGKWPICKKIQ